MNKYEIMVETASYSTGGHSSQPTAIIEGKDQARRILRHYRNAARKRLAVLSKELGENFRGPMVSGYDKYGIAKSYWMRLI